MKVEVIEISGYKAAFRALYMTNRSLTPDRIEDIHDVVDRAVDADGFIWKDLHPTVKARFNEYMEKALKYGIKAEHHQILKFIKVYISVDGLHRGAQDDYDAHAHRMDILRATTRTVKGANHAELSDFYKDKVKTFDQVYSLLNNITMPDRVVDEFGTTWVKMPWGYVAEEHQNDGDALRGLTPLGLSSNNISCVSYGEHLQHIYDLRREEATGKKANPELRQMMEMMRAELNKKCYLLGEFLGKVWVESGGGHFEEKTNTYRVSKLD